MRPALSKTWPNTWFLLLAWFVVTQTAWGAHSPDVSFATPFCNGASLGELEADLFADAADGSLDEHSLLAAALVASGVDDHETLHRYERQVAQAVDELRRSGVVAGSPKQKAQAIFEFMHRRILRAGYQLDCTDLTLALDDGRFNCVSASVLFCCLAGRFDLEARGLEVPGHAMSRLLLKDEKFEVESTCPRWFRLIDDPERRAELVEKTTGFRHGDASAARQCREVSGVELVATIYYNRGVDLLGRNEFAKAVTANAKALRLDPSNRTARGNLLATLNNWAIAQGRLGRYVEAVDLLRAGLGLEPEFRSFTVNYLYVHRQWIESLCRSRRYAEALKILAEASRELPDEPWFAHATTDVRHRLASGR